MGEILERELPLRYAGYSTNFRREAGAAGKDTRGMFRVHQFNKVEMFVVHATPDASADEHERMLAIEERDPAGPRASLPRRQRRRGRPRRARGEEVRLEGWFPSQERYRELTSTSNTTDFQARRLGIRYRDGKNLEHAAHAQRHRDHRPRAARAARELPGRGAGRAPPAVRRAGPHRSGRYRRGAGAVERDGLENRWARKWPVGSNLTPSAFQPCPSAGSAEACTQPGRLSCLQIVFRA